MNDNLLRRNFSAGTEIFRYGDMGDCAYIIDEGEVEIVIPLSKERSAVSKLGPGQLFGEMALIDNAKRLGTARASADTVVRIITSNQILSQKRAENVMAFLISQGVKPDLVSARGSVASLGSFVVPLRSLYRSLVRMRELSSRSQNHLSA